MAITFSGVGSGSYASTLTLTISGPEVARLVRQVNATPPFVPLTVISCPAPQDKAAVAFRNGSRRWILRVTGSSYPCTTPSLTGADGTSIALAPSDALIADVLAAAGLPRDYWTR